ncbi:PREDICTED: PRUPE_6G148400 [Prunus dulcis]|uniref:PREDICTED: PRUPE_6G148400 n=1 Tax=Prunus dulcis TaxID=3755 RepID=A0A5E4GCK4_PRUDU|nr:hypothetical protein L3X38_004250 [Prunus dulcis]VVA37436.1 PREDICTED: PRUPE_6G148400 [Prunus dulcis]
MAASLIFNCPYYNDSQQFLLQAAALAKPKVVSRPKSLVIRTSRKTSVTCESSSDEDDDGIAKAPIKRSKKVLVIEDLSDLSSLCHSQEFISFETKDQFNSLVANTIIAEVNEAVVAALADDNQGKHIPPFNVVEIVKDTTHEINVRTSKTVASSKTPVEIEFALHVQDTTTITTHVTSILQPKSTPLRGYIGVTSRHERLLGCSKGRHHFFIQFFLKYCGQIVQTILDKYYADLASEAQHAHLCSSIQSLLDSYFFPIEDESTIKGFMKQSVEGIQAYNQAVMEYNAGQTLTERIQSTNHILEAHLHICHEGKEELDKLEEEQKRLRPENQPSLLRLTMGSKTLDHIRSN